MLRCPISGGVIRRPAALPCSHVFERETIERRAADGGGCPVCGAQFAADQIIDIDICDEEAVPAAPRSFRECMDALEEEWSANQEEVRELRTKLESVQRKLMTTLYENEAAKRVIARLLAERGDAPKQEEEAREKVE